MPHVSWGNWRRLVKDSLYMEHLDTDVFFPPKTNITMEGPPFENLYFLLKKNHHFSFPMPFVSFQQCHPVYVPTASDSFFFLGIPKKPGFLKKTRFF